MTKSTITREQLLEIIETDHVQCGEASYLARMALAALDSEPVAWRWRWSDDVEGYWRYTEEQRETHGSVTAQPLYRHAQPAKGLELAGWQFKSVNGDWLGLIDEHGKNQAVREGCEVREVFAMADGVNERDQVRLEHAEWSQATFGDVGPIGPLKHLSKEALEAAAQPDDLSEWADMQFLLWDAQRRAGITDEQIIQAMIEKLAVNKQREWPAPKDGEPRLHIKEQPAPVVMDDRKLRALFDSWFASDCSFDRSQEASEEDNIAWRESYWYVWQRCRAAMLQAGTLTNEDTKQAWTGIPDIDNAINMLDRIDTLESCDDDRIEAVKTVLRRLAGNSPVIPDGYVMVPKEPTAQMYDAGDRQMTTKQVWDAMLAAATQLPGSEPAAVPGRWIPVSERMPEDRISVILWDAEIGEVTSGHYSHKTQTFYHCGDAIENEITHWMPPPCAPQEVKGE